MWVIIVLVFVIAFVFAIKKEKENLDNPPSNVHIRTTPLYPQQNRKLHRTNILKIDDEQMDTNSAYFSDGNVYIYSDITKTECLIGTYDSNGIVYDTDGYELGDIGGKYGRICLSRLGDLERYRMSMFNKREESELTESEWDRYRYKLKRTTRIAWFPAEVSVWGSIHDKTLHKVIAEPEYLYEDEKIKLKGHQCFIDDEDHAIGYGACFICLLASTVSRGIYADFYRDNFVEPY